MLPHPFFARPPVHEVAISTQFESIKGLDDFQLALLWREFEKEYPKTETLPELPQIIEQFDGSDLGAPGIRVQVSTSPPRNRYWFKNVRETELIQVQHDRFVYNWRRHSPDDHYPGHIALFQKYKETLHTFLNFISARGLGAFVPNQCELTYIDHLARGEGWDDYTQIGDVLTVLSPQNAKSLLPNLEDIRMSLRYLIPGDAGQPVGRLHITAEPVVRVVDRNPMLALTFVARGAPTSKDITGIEGFFEIGHNWVVQAFISLTSPRMQQLWGRKDDDVGSS